MLLEKLKRLYNVLVYRKTRAVEFKELKKREARN